MEIKKLTVLCCMAVAAFSASAQYHYRTEADTLYVPERAIIITGEANMPSGREQIAVLYSRENLSFDDPSAPRFLFLDREGKIALGIGGALKGVASYDEDGAILSPGFTTNKIPVPYDPAQASRFGADISHSSLFLKMVARTQHLGRMIVYIQTNFTGGGGYGLKLKQAYLSVNHFTVGLARSTFSDGPATAPTIDPQGPSGQVTAKNLLFQYVTPSRKGFTAALSVEVPDATYTLATGTRSIAQRVPDIPAYVQYAWGKGNHVRVSGIMRQLSYRDDVRSENKMVTGYGAQFSAVADVVGGLRVFGHYTYGKGIGRYINDLSGMGYDLVPDGANGRLKAPGMAGWTAGVQYNFTPDFFVSASYSQARLYDASNLGSDTYRMGQYATVNGFYNFNDDLRVGLEYIHGDKDNRSMISGHANRVEAMLQYSF